MPGPVLFCYDGSEGSQAAMAAAVSSSPTRRPQSC